ncbi:hypothetical protein HQN90_23655 [Paenibacillus alba]|nr:hypothetical protein [Paenibacillus alba]
MVWSIVIIISVSAIVSIVLIRQIATNDLLRSIVKEMGLRNPLDEDLQKLVAQGKKRKSIRKAQKIYGFTVREAGNYIGLLGEGKR